MHAPKHTLTYGCWFDTSIDSFLETLVKALKLMYCNGVNMLSFCFLFFFHDVTFHALQCGFKMFTRAAARKLFTNIRLKRQV